MSTTLKLKRSSQTGNAPETNQLDLGELAINTHDGKIYFKKDDGAESIVMIENQTAINISKARSLGWNPGKSNNVESSVIYNPEQEAVEYIHDVAFTRGVAHRAFKVRAGDRIDIKVDLKFSAQVNYSVAMNLRYHDGMLPDGKTHVSDQASHTFSQEDDRVSNMSPSGYSSHTGWENIAYTFIAAATGYASFNFEGFSSLNGTSVYIKQPDIVVNGSLNQFIASQYILGG
jgi:hypothetical protein